LGGIVSTGYDKGAKGRRMVRYLSRFCNDQSGATAIEYALIAVSVSIVILTAVQTIGGTLQTTFSSVSTALK